MEFKLLINADCVLAETPVWDGRIEKLYFTDLFLGDIHRFDPKTGEDFVWKTGKLIGSAIPCDDPQKLLCTLEDGIYILDLKSSSLDFICDPENGNTDNRYNDTRVDPAGRIFTSSVSKLYATDKYKPHMLGRFYMIDTNGKVKIIEDGINQFNAIVWNSDATKMFVVDTYNQKLLCYDYDLQKGPGSGYNAAIDLREFGMPDGMSIDSEDNLYICHWTGKISVWGQFLNHRETIPFPVAYVCCGGFAGKDMKNFYVATSKYLYSDEELSANKGAGGIFVGRNKIKGAKDHFYKINK
jgi:sugar lactone lactonase YvrE